MSESVRRCSTEPCFANQVMPFSIIDQLIRLGRISQARGGTYSIAALALAVSAIVWWEASWWCPSVEWRYIAERALRYVSASSADAEPYFNLEVTSRSEYHISGNTYVIYVGRAPVRWTKVRCIHCYKVLEDGSLNLQGYGSVYSSLHHGAKYSTEVDVKLEDDFIVIAYCDRVVFRIKGDGVFNQMEE